MPIFSAWIVTAAPPGQSAEAGGAFVKVDGRESLLRSVELFLNRDNVKQIQLVVEHDALEEAKRRFGAHLGFTGVKLVGAGTRWVDQIAAGADKIADDCTHVILHDAARPAVPYSDINALLEAAAGHDAVVLASPVRSTLVELDEGSTPVSFHPASRFMNLLTPQAFSKAKFLDMAKNKRELHPSQVSIVKGSALNIRIGGSGDAGLAKTMLGMLPKAKIKPPSSPFEEAQW